MSNVLADRRYSKDHEWVMLKDGKVYVGITDYAQDSLGEIVYVDLPSVGDHLGAGDDFCNIESVKAASPVINPLDGDVAEVNVKLQKNPEELNKDCYGTFIYALAGFSQDLYNGLMDAKAYETFLNTL
jgi:glycine cleavage system H protein